MKSTQTSLIALRTIAIVLIAFSIIVHAPTSPTIGWVITGGNQGPCTWFITMDGTTPVAKAQTQQTVSGTLYKPGDNYVGTAGQDVNAFTQTLITTNSQLCYGSGVFPISSTLSFAGPITIQGSGGGSPWGAIETSVTEFKWTGSTNNIPAFKLTSGSGTEGIVLKDFKLFYAGTSSGTDGIYIDGLTSFARRIDLYNVNVELFTGYGIKSRGTAFDVHYYNVGAMNNAAGNVLVDCTGGSCSQHYFYGLVEIENAAPVFGVNITSASHVGFFGGTISGGIGMASGGLFVKGATDVTIDGTNIEGASVAGSIGLQYSGTGLVVTDAGISSWGYGAKISDATTTFALNWMINAKFGANTVDVWITKGGPRNGQLGPISDASITTLQNDRCTMDLVCFELSQQLFAPSYLPCDFYVAKIGQFYDVNNCVTQNLDKFDSNFTIAMQYAINHAPSTGGIVYLASGVVSDTGTVLLNKTITIKGTGAGTLWSGGASSGTEIQWTGTNNNIPVFKITNPSLSEGIWIRDLKLFYTGASTGTSGLFIDGATSTARHIILNNVNIIGFSRYCVEVKGNAFDLTYYSLGLANCLLGGYVVNPNGQTPTQHFFYDLVIIENVPSAWCIDLTSTSFSGIYGGTIANGNLGGNGMIIGGAGTVVEGVNLEGASVAATTGLKYIGTSMTFTGGGISSWQTGVQIGDGTSASATYWEIDSRFGGNTLDIQITNLGGRSGILGPISNGSTLTIQNDRATVGGVWWELTRWYNVPSEPASASISVTASVFRYNNHDFYNQMVYVTGGTVSNVTVSNGFATGFTISTTTNIGVFCKPGCSVFVTYSSAPTMTKTYGGP